ncbi:LOW QUALITY PROTEIN: hypothetical protein HZS_5536 [Henneguya salminicola]|nr:LOW QUALITY PROTEIN: hypothetical protein HZS_5536 [Henneguya salminicola]
MQDQNQLLKVAGCVGLVLHLLIKIKQMQRKARKTITMTTMAMMMKRYSISKAEVSIVNNQPVCRVSRAFSRDGIASSMDDVDV